MPRLDSAQLGNVVDAIWNSNEDRRDLASRLTADLSKNSVLILAAWDAASLFGPIGGQLKIHAESFDVSDAWGANVFAGELVRPNGDRRCEPVLMFSDVSWQVIQTSGNCVKPERHPHLVESLLLSMQLIRDQIDSILLKPKEMRQQEIEELATEARLEADHFRRLAAWFSRVVDYI